MLPFHKTLIIVPTFNEAANVQNIINALFNVNPVLNILFIDDNSPDGTAKLIKNFRRQMPNIFLIERTGKRGLGLAYLEGFKWALDRNFEYIVTMDSDFSHDPKEIINFLLEADKYDMVVGSRYIDGIRITNWSMSRLISSYLGNRISRFFLDLPICDMTSGFNCFKGKILKDVHLEQVTTNSYDFQIELKYRLWNLGATYKEVPILFQERRNNNTMFGEYSFFKGLSRIIVLRLKQMLDKL